MSEEIFIKEKSEQPQEKVKKKRQLTQKQLDGLAKGRAKMAEKRAMKKAMAETKARLKRQKEDTKVSEETSKQHKETRQKKKKAVKFSEEQERTYKEKKEQEDKSSSKFNRIRMEALKHIKTEEDLAEYDRIMSGVSVAMSKNPNQLYEYLLAHSERLGAPPAGKKKREKKSNLSLIVEQ